MPTLVLLILLLAPGEESPSARQARLGREAAEACKAWQVVDPARSEYLASQFQAKQPFQRAMDQVSPYAWAAFLIGEISLCTLYGVFSLVSRPMLVSKRA